MALVGALCLWSTAARAASSPYACQRTPAPKFIDGKFDDWREPFFVMDNMCWRPEEGAMPVYGGPLDASATVRMAWDAKHLYLAMAVVDDYFLPAKEGPLDAGDCVIVRLAPSEQAGDHPVVPVEFVFSLGALATVQARDADGTLITPAGVKLGAARRVLPAPAKPLPGETGKQPATALTKIWYELTMPWTYLPSVNPAEDALIGAEVQVVDTDGQGIRGRLKWRGEAGVPRTPTGYGRIVLSGKE